MATIADIPFQGFHMSTVVKLSSLSKDMRSFTSEEISSRNRPGEICSFIMGLCTREEKKAIITTKLTTNDKWDMFGHLTCRHNIVFPSFDPIVLATTEIRELNGVYLTVTKQWSVANMSSTCQFTNMAPNCKEFYEQLSEEWHCTYGFDYDEPVDDESVSYGWVAGGVYFNVLNYSNRTCERTQTFDMGTTKQAPPFFVFDQDESVLDSVLLYLLS